MGKERLSVRIRAGIFEVVEAMVSDVQNAFLRRRHSRDDTLTAQVWHFEHDFQSSANAFLFLPKAERHSGATDRHRN